MIFIHIINVFIVESKLKIVNDVKFELSKFFQVTDFGAAIFFLRISFIYDQTINIVWYSQ